MPDHPSEPVIRITAIPADANAYGDIFDGWLLIPMDMGAGLIAPARSAFIVAPHVMRGWAFLPPDVMGRALSRERAKAAEPRVPGLRRGRQAWGDG